MLRIRTVFTGVAGTPYYSNLYFDAAVDLATVQSVHTAVGAFWTGIASRITTLLTWTVEGAVPNIDPVTGDTTSVTSVTPLNGVGSGGTDMLPRTSQGLIRMHTGSFNGGREIRGRLNVPGPVEFANIGDGHPDGVYTGGLLNGAVTLRDSTDTWCIWSRKNGESALVTSIDVSTNWAVLRSRRD